MPKLSSGKAPSYLYEEPGGDLGQAAVLSIKTVVVCIERKVVEVKEPKIKEEWLELGNTQ